MSAEDIDPRCLKDGHAWSPWQRDLKGVDPNEARSCDRGCFVGESRRIRSAPKVEPRRAPPPPDEG